MLGTNELSKITKIFHKDKTKCIILHYQLTWLTVTFLLFPLFFDYAPTL